MTALAAAAARALRRLPLRAADAHRVGLLRAPDRPGALALGRAAPHGSLPRLLTTLSVGSPPSLPTLPASRVVLPLPVPDPGPESIAALLARCTGPDDAPLVTQLFCQTPRRLLGLGGPLAGAFAAAAARLDLVDVGGELCDHIAASTVRRPWGVDVPCVVDLLALCAAHDGWGQRALGLASILEAAAVPIRHRALQSLCRSCVRSGLPLEHIVDRHLRGALLGSVTAATYEMALGGAQEPDAVRFLSVAEHWARSTPQPHANDPAVMAIAAATAGRNQLRADAVAVLAGVHARHALALYQACGDDALVSVVIAECGRAPGGAEVAKTLSAADPEWTCASAQALLEAHPQADLGVEALVRLAELPSSDADAVLTLMANSTTSGDSLGRAVDALMGRASGHRLALALFEAALDRCGAVASSEALCKLFDDALQEGCLGGATGVLRAVMAWHPDDADALGRRLVDAQQGQGDFGAALDTLQLLVAHGEDPNKEWVRALAIAALDARVAPTVVLRVRRMLDMLRVYLYCEQERKFFWLLVDEHPDVALDVVNRIWSRGQPISLEMAERVEAVTGHPIAPSKRGDVVRRRVVKEWLTKAVGGSL